MTIEFTYTFYFYSDYLPIKHYLNIKNNINIKKLT